MFVGLSVYGTCEDQKVCQALARLPVISHKPLKSLEQIATAVSNIPGQTKGEHNSRFIPILVERCEMVLV